MSNSMKLITRTLLIVLLMAAGAWLNRQLDIYAAASGNLRTVASVAMYAVYLIIGIAVGSTVNPRFTKNKNKFVYLFPIFCFVVIGVSQLLYYFAPMLPFPWIAGYLSHFTYVSWTLTGLFCALAFR